MTRCRRPARMRPSRLPICGELLQFCGTRWKPSSAIATTGWPGSSVTPGANSRNCRTPRVTCASNWRRPMDAEIRPRRGRQKTKSSPRKKPVFGRAASDDAGKKLLRAEMLLSITRELAGTDTLNDVLVKMVDITSRETDCERATLFLNDDQTGELYSRVAQGEISREIRLLNTKGIAGHVFTAGQGVIIDDAYSDPRFNPDIDRQTGFETRSILCAPVRTVKGEIIGVAQ